MSKKTKQMNYKLELNQQNLVSYELCKINEILYENYFLEKKIKKSNNLNRLLFKNPFNMKDKQRLIKSKFTILGKEKTGAFNILVNQKIKIMFSKDKIIKKKWEEKMKNQRTKIISAIKKCIIKN